MTPFFNDPINTIIAHTGIVGNGTLCCFHYCCYSFFVRGLVSTKDEQKGDMTINQWNGHHVTARLHLCLCV